MQNPDYYLKLLDIRDFLETTLPSFPNDQQGVTACVVNKILGLERVVCYYNGKDLVLNKDPKNKVYVCIGFDGVYKDREKILVLDVNNDSFVEDPDRTTQLNKVPVDIVLSNKIVYGRSMLDHIKTFQNNGYIRLF